MALLMNDRIRLRALEPEDLTLLYRWENDACLWEEGSTLAPFSRYILREYIAHSGRDIYESHQLRLMVENREAGVGIGLIDLFDFDPHANRAACGILIDTAYRGQGFSTEAIRLLMEYAYTFLKIHQLYAHVPVHNKPSLLTFAHCGFVECGRLKDWIQTSKGYSDVYIMQAFDDQFK